MSLNRKTVKELLEERALKFKEMEDASQVGDAEKRDLTDQEFANFKKLKEEVSGIDTKIERARELEDIQKMRSVTVGTGAEGGSGLSEKEIKNLNSFSLVRALSLVAQGKPFDGVEKEVTALGEISARANNIVPDEKAFYVPAEFLQKRGQTVTGTSSGGTLGDQGGKLVDTDMMPLIDTLWSQTWMQAAGVRFLPGLSGGDLLFPVQTTKPVVTELTEIQEDSYTEILFSDFKMSPKRRGSTVPLSRQLLIQSSLNAQALVLDNLSKAVSQTMNVEALSILLGNIIAGNNNLVALDTNGAAPTWEDIVALEQLVDVKDALRSSPKYVTNAAVRAKLKTVQKFTGTNGEAVWGANNTLNDYQAIVTNLVPSNITKGTGTNLSAIVFGNFDDMLCGIWGGGEFIIDPYTAKRKAQIEITTNMFYDIKLARTASFAGIKDAITVI